MEYGAADAGISAARSGGPPHFRPATPQARSTLKGIATEPAIILARCPQGRSQKRSGARDASQNRNSHSGFVLFAALSAVSFAQTSNSGGVNPKAEGIGSTSSTHNPRPSSPGPTGMEKGKATGSEMGTDTSTHNPSENTPTHDPSEKR